MNDLAPQRAAAAEARLLRADYLIAIHNELIEPMDLIVAAQSRDHKALRTVRLQQVFITAPKPAMAWRVLRTRMLAALDLDTRTPDKNLTVGWLLDPRAGGRRWYALQDALRPRDVPPWTGSTGSDPPP